MFIPILFAIAVIVSAGSNLENCVSTPDESVKKCVVTIENAKQK